METKRAKLIAGVAACIIGTCLFLPPATAQSLWSDNGPNANLIADNVAKKKGDILTIIIKESQKVEDKQEVKLEKESTLDSVLESFNISDNTFNPLPDFIQETTKDFEGKSDYNKENAFETRITVQVIDVMPNGNLVIEGRRNIFMDDEEKKIKITGTVRPLDITPDNTVLSSKVCDARVSYDGEGTLSRTTEKGWLDAILDFIWPF
jgi:flagellar L-ring protein precursor FlgH